MTQNEEILAYIREHGSITSLDAITEFNCLRLASRISELKDAGYPIKTKMETSKSKKGKTSRYARYFL